MMYLGIPLFALLSVVAGQAYRTTEVPPPPPQYTPRPVANSYARLNIPEWTQANALDKADDKVWGGPGDRSWEFEFKDDYKKERFTVEFFKKDGEWDQDKAEAGKYKVDKKLTCIIEAADGLGPKTYPEFKIIKSSEPYFERTEAKGVKASCTEDN